MAVQKKIDILFDIPFKIYLRVLRLKGKMATHSEWWFFVLWRKKRRRVQQACICDNLRQLSFGEGFGTHSLLLE